MNDSVPLLRARWTPERTGASREEHAPPGTGPGELTCGKSCVTIKPTEECAATFSLYEMRIYTDRLAELEARLTLVTAPSPAPAA